MAQPVYEFKIRTKNGGQVGNITKHASSLPDAERQLRLQYPDCTVLSVKVRDR